MFTSKLTFSIILFYYFYSLNPNLSANQITEELAECLLAASLKSHGDLVDLAPTCSWRFHTNLGAP